MDDLLDEFPRAACHMDKVDEKVMQFEMRFSTPVNADDMRNIIAEVHADHEDCPCACCGSA